MASPALQKQPQFDKLNQQFIAGKAETWSDSGGISYVRYLPETHISYDDMVQIYVNGAGGSAVNNRKLVVMIDMRYVGQISPEALDFSVSGVVLERLGAMALVADHLEARALSHRYICGYKPNLPIRVFSNPEAARLWLLSLLHDGTVE
ncbi:MAG: hypothetical protein ACRC3B_11080 [Bacteroidia bacterium]